MATKVFTNALMDYVSAIGSTSVLATPTFSSIAATWATGMNGTVGPCVMSGNLNGQVFLPFASLHDDATVPLVITITSVLIELDYNTTNGPMAPGDCTSVIDLYGVFAAQPEGNSSGHLSQVFAPAPIFGGDQRADLFVAGSMLWAYGLDFTGVFGAHSVTCVISNFTCTVTYTTPSTGTVTSISPSSGSVNGSQSVTIRGTGFTGAPSATVGGVLLTSFVVVSDTEITGVTGAHAPGAVDVDVTGVGTLTAGYTYVLDHLRLPPMPTRTPARQGGR